LILGTNGPLTPAEIAEMRQRVTQSLSKNRAGRIVLPKVDSFIEDCRELECEKGDWVVAVDRGRLEGIPDTFLLPITHWTFSDRIPHPAQRQLFDAVIERLSAN
jgi:hypothetical protein